MDEKARNKPKRSLSKPKLDELDRECRLLDRIQKHRLTNPELLVLGSSRYKARSTFLVP